MGAEIEALNKQEPLQKEIEGVLVNHLLFVLYPTECPKKVLFRYSFIIGSKLKKTYLLNMFKRVFERKQWPG